MAGNFLPRILKRASEMAVSGGICIIRHGAQGCGESHQQDVVRPIKIVEGISLRR